MKNLIAENERRKNVLDSHKWNPATGSGCIGERRKTLIPGWGILHLPLAMLSDATFSVDMDWNKLCSLRFRYDFEFWLYTCVPVRDKNGAGMIPFVLNAGQRKVVSALEKMRMASQPMRLIVLKARQWGCSTIVESYMAWIQIVHKCYWNSAICAQRRDTSAVLKDMFTHIVKNYPEEYMDTDNPLKIKSRNNSRNIFELLGRDNSVVMTSAISPDGARGCDLAMAHLSEVAFWADSRCRKPENVVRAICASINLLPLTFVAVESTANGVGGYFHKEWINAVAGISDKTPVFVGWHEIPIYSTPIADAEALWMQLDGYEQKLWDMGLTLEQINWYHHKRKEYQDHRDMMAEYPTTANEAFNATSTSVFDTDSLEKLRDGCMPPLAFGELTGKAERGYEALQDLHFVKSDKGLLKVWKQPDNTIAKKNRYVVSVDIGGRSNESDFSVIAVMDRLNSARPELVAQWRGHIDHDLLAWKAAAIAKWYNNATLIIESNTLESDRTEGDHGEYILSEIERHYRHLYRRSDGKPGFHTNRSSKTRIVNSMIAAVRDRGYIERDEDAIREAFSYEHKPKGTFGAKDGMNDDIVMTRALALSYCYELRMHEEKRGVATATELLCA